jgi:hypothetical protein
VSVLQPPVLKSSHWEVVLSFSHQRVKTKQTNKKITSSNAIQFQLVLQHPVLVLLLSHQRKRKKIGSLETALWMSVLGCSSPASYSQPSAAAGFVYLEFSWQHAPIVFSSIQPYPPFCSCSPFFFLFRVHVGRCPTPTLWCSGHPALFGMCHFCFFSAAVYYSVWFFLFFSWVGVSCPGGYADLAQGCL